MVNWTWPCRLARVKMAPLSLGALPGARGMARASDPLTLPMEPALPLTVNVLTATPVGLETPVKTPLRKSALVVARATVAAGSAIPVESRTLPSRESNDRVRRVVFDIGTSLLMTDQRRTATGRDAARCSTGRGAGGILPKGVP